MAEYGKNNRRVPTRVHTRELDRGIARLNMKKAGLHQVAKGKHSFFSENWEKYANLGLKPQRKKAQDTPYVAPIINEKKETTE